MSVTIRIASSLRKYTGNSGEIEVETGTLREAIDSIEAHGTGFKAALLNSKGELNYSTVVFVNEEDVRFGQKLDAPLNSGDDVLILPSASGGRQHLSVSVVCKIPTPLQRFTGGQSEIEVEAGTLRDAFDAIEQKHPGFKPKVLNAAGEIHRYIVVYVDEVDVRQGRNLDTRLKSGDEVLLLPVTIGGA